MTAECEASRSGHSIDYKITGTADEIDEAIAEIRGIYPTPGYGTWFNWPPGQLLTCGRDAGKPNTNLAPTDIGDGRWIARGHRSASCD
jgi:hypothetical protein